MQGCVYTFAQTAVEVDAAVPDSAAPSPRDGAEAVVAESGDSGEEEGIALWWDEEDKPTGYVTVGRSMRFLPSARDAPLRSFCRCVTKGMWLSFCRSSRKDV